MSKAGAFAGSSPNASWFRPSVLGFGLLIVLAVCLAIALNCFRTQEGPMPKLKWLDGYSGQTVDQLLAMEGAFRIDSLSVTFDQAMNQKAARVGMEGLTDEERVILAVEALESEVNSGGYNLFFNSSREYAPIIVESLRRIGCPRTAEITQKALDALGISDLSDKEIRAAMAKESQACERSLDLCDRQHLEAPENIAESLFVFIKANKDKIHP